MCLSQPVGCREGKGRLHHAPAQVLLDCQSCNPACGVIEHEQDLPFIDENETCRTMKPTIQARRSGQYAGLMSAGASLVADNAQAAVTDQ